MAGIATPQEISIDHDAEHVRLYIHGSGQMSTLKMPPNVAHWLARQLVGEANALEKENNPGRWPRLNRS